MQQQNFGGFDFISCDALSFGDYGGYGAIGAANIRYLEAQDTGPDGPCDGRFVEHGHYGYRQMWLPDTQEHRDLISDLELRNPLIDEEIYSEIEKEWIDEAWECYGANDLRRDLSQHVREAVEDGLVANSDLRDIYDMVLSVTNRQPVMEYGGACLPLTPDVVFQVETEVIDRLLSRAVEGNVPFDPISGIDDRQVDILAVHALADWHEESGRGTMAAFLRSWTESLSD